MSNNNARRPPAPQGSPWTPDPNRDANDVIEETQNHFKTAGKFLFDFLVSDDQRDAIALTRGLAALRPDMARELAEDERRAEEARRAQASQVPPPAPGERPAPRVGRVSVVDDDDEVLLIVEEPEPAPCDLCKGRPCVAFNPTTQTRVAVACPKCKAPPKKLPARLAR